MSLSTTTIGSYPRPKEVRRARWQHVEEEIDDAALAGVEREAVARLVQAQTAGGLDLLVDGQVDRSDMVSFFAERLDGFDEGGWVRCFDNRYCRRPRVTDEIARVEPLIVDRWKLTQATTQKPLKAILTGPYTLMHWSFDEHYRSREKCCMALADALAEEVQELVAAGAREIQLDEPAIGSRAEELELVREALDRVTAGVPETTRSWVHVAYGDLAPVIAQILTLPVNGFLLELANSNYAILDALAALPADRLLGGGVVDALSPEIESEETIRGRIEKLLTVVPAERLWVTPDAGLRALSEEQAEAKVAAMIRAAGSF